MDEDVIKRKLLIDGDGTGDDRRLNLLLKSFYKWSNSADTDSTEVELGRDRILAQVSQCEFSLAKSRLAVRASNTELQNYENLSQEIKRLIEKAKKDIEGMKIAFIKAKTVRKNRIEYDVLAKVILEQPDRKETNRKLDELMKDHAHVKETCKNLDKVLDDRRRRFFVFLSSIFHLREALANISETEMMDISLDTLDGDDKIIKDGGD